MTEKSTLNLDILRTKRGFNVKIKTFSIIFKEISGNKNCLRPESAPLILRFLVISSTEDK